MAMIFYLMLLHQKTAPGTSPSVLLRNINSEYSGIVTFDEDVTITGEFVANVIKPIATVVPKLLILKTILIYER